MAGCLNYISGQKRFMDDIDLDDKSERKKMREKNRRSEVNDKFKDLAEAMDYAESMLLKKLDVSELEKTSSQKSDLICRAILVIRTMLEENGNLRMKLSAIDSQISAPAPHLSNVAPMPVSPSMSSHLPVNGLPSLTKSQMNSVCATVNAQVDVSLQLQGIQSQLNHILQLQYQTCQLQLQQQAVNIIHTNSPNFPYASMAPSHGYFNNSPMSVPVTHYPQTLAAHQPQRAMEGAACPAQGNLFVGSSPANNMINNNNNNYNVQKQYIITSAKSEGVDTTVSGGSATTDYDSGSTTDDCSSNVNNNCNNSVIVSGSVGTTGRGAACQSSGCCVEDGFKNLDDFLDDETFNTVFSPFLSLSDCDEDLPPTTHAECA